MSEKVTNQLFIGFFAGIVWGIIINTVAWSSPGPAMIQWCEEIIKEVE